MPAGARNAELLASEGSSSAARQRRLYPIIGAGVLVVASNTNPTTPKTTQVGIRNTVTSTGSQSVGSLASTNIRIF